MIKAIYKPENLKVTVTNVQGHLARCRVAGKEGRKGYYFTTDIKNLEIEH